MGGAWCKPIVMYWLTYTDQVSNTGHSSDKSTNCSTGTGGDQGDKSMHGMNDIHSTANGSVNMLCVVCLYMAVRIRE